MARAHTYRTEGVVLRRSDFGEADRLLTLFTRDFGKVRAIAKGARKPQSRKTGHVELFMRSRFLIATGRNLDLITQAEIIEVFDGLRQDLIRTTYAAYVVELLDQFTAEADKNVDLYDLLVRALGWLATENNFLLIARYYELRLLSLIGYQPELFRGVVSGEPILEEDQYFSAELGGLIRPQQLGSDRRARPISAAAVKVLRYLQTRSWETVANLQLRRELHRELEEIMHYYLTFQLERQLKAVDFLERLRHEAFIYREDES